ncbi:hypothetical protein Pst134EA_020713 [Puccinia striiformis f. sp. tritici]|uniref:hypothetical protein n=1 Tax=Puccinia striiformis f. sp. tritici TaxID=168172 RepID=UPI002007A2D8|nr:hypothetical protein Pst134EA_020713 [Puccinia striiformis f. sp. tritici]KAH9456803.1 hypothetical protein Pst134EA_020713 [Puccinia striiformis f. sp. tritici]
MAIVAGDLLWAPPTIVLENVEHFVNSSEEGHDWERFDTFEEQLFGAEEERGGGGCPAAPVPTATIVVFSDARTVRVLCKSTQSGHHWVGGLTQERKRLPKPEPD